MDFAAAFEEWDTYALEQRLHQRAFDTSTLLRNANIKIIAITGIRRSGKTSLLMLLRQHLAKQKKPVCYINLEDNRLQQPHVLDDIIKWFGDTGYLLLDEITSIPDWEGWLARTHELLKGKLFLIVSSSRKTLATPSKPLRGRILPFELYPLSFQEHLDFNHIPLTPTTAALGKREQSFHSYQRYGGFPEVTLTTHPLDKTRILNSYFKDIIALDVAELSHEDITIVETFAQYVLQSTYFSASKCLNFFKSLGFKIGKEKLLRLEQKAQTSYLFFFLPIFSFSIKDRTQYPRKIHAGDTGFFYAIKGLEDKGRVIENLVFLALQQKKTSQQDICYWKNKEGKETDFIIKQGTTVQHIIQVTTELEQPKTLQREIQGLVACAHDLGVNHGTIITESVEKNEQIEGITIRFVPYMKWFLSEDQLRIPPTG